MSTDPDIGQRLESGRYDEAFDLLVERYKNKVFRLACGLMQDPALAEDMAQETFVKIWKALPGYRGQSAISTWIYAITRNTCLTELARRSRYSAVSLQSPELEVANETLEVFQVESRVPGSDLDLAQMLGRLPQKYRQVITLFYLEERAYEEVSAMLGIPMGTVKTLLFRARKELLKLPNRTELPRNATVRKSDGRPRCEESPGMTFGCSR